MVQVQSIRLAAIRQAAIRPAVIAGPGSKRALISERFFGFMIIAVAPTLFWTAMIYVVTSANGTPVATWAACCIAALMFTFLFCVWAAFAVARKTDTAEQDDC
jgi:hypothetical protein